MSRFTVLRGSLILFLLATMGIRLPAQPQTTVPTLPVDRADAAVAKALAVQTDIDVLNVPLGDFVKTLAKDHGISIRFDKSGLQRAGVAPSTRITASFKQVPLGLALRQVLRPLKLQHHIVDGAVVIDDIGLPLDALQPPSGGPVGAQAEFKDKRAAPMRRAGAPNMARRGKVVNANREQVTLQQLRLVLQVELKFVKSVCAPTPQQMQLLKQEGLKQIADMSKAARANNNRPQVVRRNGGVVLLNNEQVSNDERRRLQEKLSELVRAQMSSAQASRYESEIQKRNANLRQACARNLVVALDEELSLTEWQRQKLSTELVNSWNDSWTPTVVLGSTTNLGFLPNIPDELVVPYLDSAQRTLWNSLPKRGDIWGAGATPFLGMGPPALDDQE